MTDFNGAIGDTLAAAPFPGAAPGEPKPPSISPLTYPVVNFNPITAVPSAAAPFERVRTFVAGLGVDPTDATNIGEDQPASGVAGVVTPELATHGPEKTLDGARFPGLEFDFFEKWIVFPGRLDLGNVLSTQVRNLEIMNTARRTSRTWQGFINNAGGGVSATNLPSLPTVFAGLESFVVDIQIDTIGPPNIDGTLDFDVDLDPPDVIQIPITGQRITIFQFRPQTPIGEVLEFKTDIIGHDDGTEQRINVREAPRQRIQFTVRVDDDRSRDAINSVLYDWQSRVFGVPIWWEQKRLDAPVAINDTVIQVDTANADFRAGGLVMLFDNNFAFEALEILTVNPNDLVVTTGILSAFDAVDTVVTPMRTAYTKPNLQFARFRIGPMDFAFDWTTLDNVDLADTSAFDTYQGVGETAPKVLLNRLNFLGGATLRDGYRRKITRLDHETGPFVQFSPWAKSRPTMPYGFEASSFADVWEFRQLVHALRGSQVSFYLETGRADVKAVLDILDLANSIDIENVGFTDFVGQVVPRADLQVRRTDGTLSRHQITNSVVVNDDVERLTITPSISPALPVADIERIEFLTLGRIDRDEVRLNHRQPGQARIDFPFMGLPG